MFKNTNILTSLVNIIFSVGMYFNVPTVEDNSVFGIIAVGVINLANILFKLVTSRDSITDFAFWKSASFQIQVATTALLVMQYFNIITLEQVGQMVEAIKNQNIFGILAILLPNLAQVLIKLFLNKN